MESFTEEEIEVAKALNGLEETHRKTWYFKWARRRKRSALDEAAPPPIQPAEKPASPVPEPAARTSASPVSPLEFAGVSAASDEKDKPRHAKVPKIKAKKDSAETMQELTKTKQVLRGEIENAREHRNKLLPHNSELKSVKKEVLSKKEEPPQTVGVNLALELSQFYQTPMVMMPNHHHHHHRQPYIPDPTARSYFRFPNGPQAQKHGMGSSGRVGPLGFDLNLLPEEYAAAVEQPQPSDAMVEMADRRARSADARRRRRGMMKIKSMRSACGIKLPADE